MNQEVTVIGAGIVGICSALHLQRNGFKVTLLDRRPPASEASFGNAGVISRGSIFPEAAPGIQKKIPGILSNRNREARLHYGYLGQLTPWARRLLKNTRAERFENNILALNDIVGRCLVAHKALLHECNGLNYLRESGWIKLFRQLETFEASALEQQMLEKCGVAFERLDASGVQTMEAGLRDIFAAGLWIKNTASVSNPGAVGRLYAELFLSEGGTIELDELKRLEQRDGYWQIELSNNQTKADKLVIALGAWSKVILETIGYNIPMVVERGYHMHYDLQPGVSLTRPVYDVDGGYVMSPMQKGLRVTTGVEWGSEETAPTPVQLRQVKPYVSQAIDIDTELDPEPWLGRRPCTPDSLPIIGSAPKHKNLWLAFGHGHMGFSMGPITGQLIADMVAGKSPVMNTEAFSPARF